MEAEPPGANKSGAEMLQDLIEHGNPEGVQPRISVVSDEEVNQQLVLALVKEESGSAGIGGHQRNMFNVSYTEDGKLVGGQDVAENDDSDDDEIAQEEAAFLHYTTGEYWAEMATSQDFETLLDTDLRTLLSGGWFGTDAFKMTLELFRPLLQTLSSPLREQRYSFEVAFNSLFPVLSPSATALLAWLLTMRVYEPGNENIISAEFRRQFREFKKLPSPKNLSTETQLLAFRNIVLRYIAQLPESQEFNGAQPDFFESEKQEPGQPESSENEGDQGAGPTADLLSICKHISVNVVKLKDSEAHHVVSTVSLPSNGSGRTRSQKRRRSGQEVGEVSVPSEQITTLDDTNPTPRKKRSCRSFAEKMADIPDDTPEKKPKRRLRSLVDPVYVDLRVPLEIDYLSYETHPSHRPQHNSDMSRYGEQLVGPNDTVSKKRKSGSKAGSSKTKTHRHFHRADLVDDSVPLYNPDEVLVDIPAPTSSKSKKHRSSLPANLVTESSDHKILTEIRNELGKRVLFAPPRREKGAKGPPKITSKVCIRANVQDKFGHFHKLPFEEMQKVVPQAIKMLNEKLPHLKVEPPPEFQAAVKSEDDKPLNEPKSESPSPELMATDGADGPLLSAEKNREKSMSKSPTPDLKMTLKLESSTPQKGHDLRSGAKKDLNVSIISTTTPDKRVIYEELLEENEDKALHYCKHHDGPKLQAHLYDNELSRLKSVHRATFYPFVKNDQRIFPEIPPKVQETWQFRDEKDFSDVTAADFVPIEQQNLALITNVSQPSLPNINFNCLAVSAHELHVAGTRLEKVFCERREEIGDIQSYGHSEPFGAPVDIQAIYLYPGEPVAATFTNEDGVQQRKLLPPGCDFPTGILRPIELNLGRFSIATEDSGCGLFHFDKYKAVSKLYEPDGDLRPTSAFGWHLHNAKFTKRSYGWKKEPTGVEEISTIKLKELQQKLSKSHPNFTVPDRKALNPEVVDGLKLKYVLDNFEKSTQTPHLMTKIPGSMLHAEQDVMMFDHSNSKSAGKFLKVNNKSRKNLRSFMAIGPHSSTEWMLCRPGFFGNVFVHYGEFLLLVLHRRFLKELLAVLKEDAKNHDKESLPDCVLYHEKIKIDPRYLVSNGLVVSYAILDSGSIASIGFNGAFMLYAITEGACEISQCLLAEGLLYFSQKGVPDCDCVDDGKDPTVAELQEYNDAVFEARYAMLWAPGPIVAPPFLCALHNSKIETEEKYLEHMKKRHLKPATRAKTGGSW